ncbi:hypothetical protein O181_033242 [Austropuccinia psidii MF-1]|uniref:J domain-containing protein n=1 Tax=Austropuccinia psidii MF-1 TaxID=1389203 RepID=A0A9Q3H6Z4_9BASI|nr:hypothetical protein [Austropuccinia psidii MF-1]
MFLDLFKFIMINFFRAKSSSISRSFHSYHQKIMSNYPFPNNPNPNPFEIFHLPRSATPSQIKQRYYQLVKIYHPDIATQSLPSKSKGSSDNQILNRFKLIVQAYELLRSPSRRQNYLTYGVGWPHIPHRSPHSGSQTKSKSNHTYHSKNYQSFWFQFLNPSYPNHSYSSKFQSDPFNNHHSSKSTFKEQWHRNGLFSKNGIFISSVGCIGLVGYILQLWYVFPWLNSNHSDKLLQHNQNDQLKRFLEPQGDQRLDQEAWSKFNSIQFINSNFIKKTSSPLSSKISFENSSHPPHDNTTKYRLTPGYLKNQIDQNNAKSASDLDFARSTALPPNQFSHRFSHISSTHLPLNSTPNQSDPS